MKKIIPIILILVLCVVCLCACNNDSDPVYTEIKICGKDYSTRDALLNAVNQVLLNNTIVSTTNVTVANGYETLKQVLNPTKLYTNIYSTNSIWFSNGEDAIALATDSKNYIVLGFYE